MSLQSIMEAVGLRRPRRHSLSLTGTALGAVGVGAIVGASVLVTMSEPRSEVQVRLSDGAVWLPSTVLGGVSLLDGGSGSIATSLGVAGNNDDFEVVQWGSDAIIVNHADGTVSRLDGAAWSITTGRVKFGEPGEQLGVVTGHDVGWLVQAGSVSPLDLETLAQSNPVPIGSQFSDGLVTDDGDFLYSSDDPNANVRRFHIDGTPPVDIDELSGPTALANLGSVDAAVDLDDHSVWLAGQGTVCDRLEVPDTAVLHVGGGDEHLFVVTDDGGAFLWNPSETGCPGPDDFITLGSSNYGRPVLTNGWAVVQDIDSGEVLVVDFDALDDVRRRTLDGVAPGTAVQLVAENGAVWYNDPASSRAGLVRRDGTIVPIAKYEEGSDTGFVAAPLEDPATADVAVAGAQQTSENPPDPTEESTPPVGSGDAETTPPDDGTTTTTTPGGQGGESPDTTVPDPASTTTTPDGSTPDGSTPDSTPDVDGGPPDTLDPNATTSTTVDSVRPLEIQIGASAQEIVAGGTIRFQSITVQGNPNKWTLIVNPNTGNQAPLERFGTFDYTFFDVGRYQVSIEACDPEGNCDTPTVSVNVVADPAAIALVAAFSAPATARVGETVTLLDASQGGPATWRWDFDGGSPRTSREQNPSVSWDTPGDKTVSLTVGRGSQSQTVTRVVRVEALSTEPAPFDLSCSPISIDTTEQSSCSLIGDPADFDGLSWNVTLPNPAQGSAGPAGVGRYVVSSNVEGTIQVRLSGTDRNTSDPVSRTVNVTVTNAVSVDPPSGSIQGPSSVVAGTTANFSAPGTGISSWSWSAQGSPTFSNPNGESTTIRWSQPGTFQVQVTLSGNGNTVLTRNVTVTAATTTTTAPAITFNPTCGPSTRPANGTSAATCRLADGNFDEFSSLSYSVSNPSGLQLNQWGSPGETYIASFDPGSVTVNVSATHIATGTPVSGGPFTITFEAVATASPFDMSCGASTANVSTIVNCSLVGDPADFSSIGWNVSVGSPASLEWWPAGATVSFRYNASGAVTVTLTAVDTLTGNTVERSRVVTFQAETTTTPPTTEPPTTEPPTTAPPTTEPPTTEPPTSAP